jgi:hypothetical protein
MGRLSHARTDAFRLLLDRSNDRLTWKTSFIGVRSIVSRARALRINASNSHEGCFQMAG